MIVECMQAEALEREAKRRRVDSAELASMRVRPPCLLLPVVRATAEHRPKRAAQALRTHTCWLVFYHIAVHTWHLPS